MSTTLILFPQPIVRPQISHRDLLELQNAVYESLIVALHKIDFEQRRIFLARSLTIILDLPNLANLPMEVLTELLFETLDGTTEPRQLLNQQNVFFFVSQLLRGRG